MYLETTTARTEPDATYLPCVGSNTSLQYLLCWYAWAEWHNRCVSTRKGWDDADVSAVASRDVNLMANLVEIQRMRQSQYKRCVIQRGIKN